MSIDRGQLVSNAVDALDRKLAEYNVTPDDPEVSIKILDELTKRGLIGISHLQIALLEIEARGIAVTAAHHPEPHDKEPDIYFPAHWIDDDSHLFGNDSPGYDH